MNYSVHNEDGFARVYDEDDIIQIRRGDLRALLDLATGSMDFGSGFWDNEQVEIARATAVKLDIDPNDVTTRNFICDYNGGHDFTGATRSAHWGETYTNCLRCSLIKILTPHP